jgi:hypothetical protein
MIGENDGFGDRTLRRRELCDRLPDCVGLLPVLSLVPRWQWLNWLSLSQSPGYLLHSLLAPRLGL